MRLVPYCPDVSEWALEFKMPAHIALGPRWTLAMRLLTMFYYRFRAIGR